MVRCSQKQNIRRNKKEMTIAVEIKKEKSQSKLEAQIRDLQQQISSLEDQIKSLNAPKKMYSWDYERAIAAKMLDWPGLKLLVVYEKFMAPRMQFTAWVAKNKFLIATDSMAKQEMQHWLNALAKHVAQSGFEDTPSEAEYRRQYEESPVVKEEERLRRELQATQDTLDKKLSAQKGLETKARRKIERADAARRSELKQALLNGCLEATPERMEDTKAMFPFTAMLLTGCRHDTRHTDYQYSKWSSSRGYRTVGGLIHTFRLVEIKDQFGNSWPDLYLSEQPYWYELPGNQEVRFVGKVVDGKLDFHRPAKTEDAA
jgi:hypothetical protein